MGDICHIICPTLFPLVWQQHPLFFLGNYPPDNPGSTEYRLEKESAWETRFECKQQNSSLFLASTLSSLGKLGAFSADSLALFSKENWPHHNRPLDPVMPGTSCASELWNSLSKPLTLANLKSPSWNVHCLICTSNHHEPGICLSPMLSFSRPVQRFAFHKPQTIHLSPMDPPHSVS